MPVYRRWMQLLVIVTIFINVQAVEFPTLDHIRSSTPAEIQSQAAQDLIQRLIGLRASDFTATVDSTIGPSGKDTFKLTLNDNHVTITGTSGVVAAWGFYYYLSQYCGCHISWGGNQVNVPVVLPSLPSGTVTVTSNDRFRYYQNVCTVSYSFVWWNWTRWEREIDWMAMSGINLPLAFNGQEAIWQRVYLKMGLTQAEIDNHFGGTAFLAWSRMGNMHGWGGPLPQSWHVQQVALQHQILQRMRDLGMVPVLPAFAGHVPDAFTRIYPSSNVTHLANWGGFNSTYCCTLLLDLQDKQFVPTGQAFLKEYISEFGTDHIYNTDTFNEMDPKSSDPAYLDLAGKAVYNAMLAGDPDAIWLMQGWLFESAFWKPPQAKALLTSVPLGKMLVLDLFSDVSPQYTRLESYYGQPFIWCMLHDFGGTNSLYGAIETINKGPSEGRAFKNSTMIGIGLTMEGINQNDVIYEFMMENSWQPKVRDIYLWMQQYSIRRYGRENADAQAAWQILRRGIYNCTNTGVWNFGHRVVTQRPQFKIPIDPDVWYDPEELYVAWDHMLAAAESFYDSSLFRYDLVDVTRQALEVISIFYSHEAIARYKVKDLPAYQYYSSELLSLLLDLEKLLATDEHFLLGAWLESAKKQATNEQERQLYEYNARNQLTLWGPDANILDYANKQWSGLVKAYYYPRWKLFFDELTAQWSNATFDEKKFQSDVFEKVEKPFTFDRSEFPNYEIGDQIWVAREIHAHYRPVTQENWRFFYRLPGATHKRLQKLEWKSPKYRQTSGTWMMHVDDNGAYNDNRNGWQL